MRKKTLLKTILPLCIVAITALCISLSNVFATATAAEPTWSINSTPYSKELPRQSILQIPDNNKATLNGTDYSLDHVVTYPSGKTTTGDKVSLTELGEYKIKYSFSASEQTKEHTFKVVNTTESLFALSEDCDVVGGAKVPDYIVNGKTAPKDAIEAVSVAYNGKTQGVKVTANGENAVLRYDGVIDASKINLNTDLIDFMVTPAVYDEERGEGVLEFKDGAKIQIKFYDAVYTDINLTFNVASYNRQHAPVTVSANDNVSGVTLGNQFYNSSTGAGSTYCQSTFYGTYNPDGRNGGYWPNIIANDVLPSSGAHRPTTSSCHLRYDATTNAAYSYPNAVLYISEASGYPKATWDKDVRGNGSPFMKYVPYGYFFSDGNWDFDDYYEYGRGDEFYGFPSGMIKMEIRFPGLARNSANFMIFNIGGQDLATWDEASYETKISVDTAGADENNLPEVIAGKNSFYPVYNAYAYNYVQGVLPTPSVRVYFDKKTEDNLLPIVNGVFPVTKTGKYYIEYTATPEPTIGDPVSKTLEVVAVDYRDYDVSYDINNLIPTTAYVGDKINLYKGQLNFTLNGANVNAEKSPFFNLVTEVYFNGRTIAITKDTIDYFIANDTGLYTIVYSSVDYAGQKTYLTKREIVVSKNTNVAFGDIILPKALVGGTKYEFPIPSAYLATESGKINASVVVKVNGVDVTKTAYTVPTDLSEITVRYEATAGGITTPKEFILDVINNGDKFKMNDGAKDFVPYLTNYLTFNDSAYNYAGFSKEAVPFVANNPSDSQNVEFINAINLNFYRLMFKLDGTNPTGSMFRVVMTDALNPAQSVTLGFIQRPEVKEEVDGKVVTKEAAKLEFYNVLDNGELVYLGKVDGDFTPTGFNLIVDAKGNVYNGASSVCKIAKYTSGFDFVGFDSGYVYTSFGIKGTGTCKFEVSNIAGQTFNLTLDDDYGKPVVYFDDELPGYKETDVGDSYVIKFPTAYDVLNAIESISVTIKYPDNSKKTLNSNQDGFKLEFTNYGRYEITFRARDYANKFIDVKKVVVVKDMSPPTITINGDIPAKIAVGTIFSLPSATATDKIGSNIEVTIFYMYNGRMRSLFSDNEQYTNPIYFEAKGIYTIYYYAVGENGNRSIKTVIVEAE